MSSHDAFGWRDRAIALASVGAAALSRFVFSPGDVTDPQPLEMQVLVTLALQDSLAADSPHRSGTRWLSLALGVEQAVVERIVGRLENTDLVRRSSDALDEIEWEMAGDDDGGDEDVVDGELSITLTDAGFATLDRWLDRARLNFRGWPPERIDVDDAVG